MLKLMRMICILGGFGRRRESHGRTLFSRRIVVLIGLLPLLLLLCRHLLLPRLLILTLRKLRLRLLLRHGWRCLLPLLHLRLLWRLIRHLLLALLLLLSLLLWELPWALLLAQLLVLLLLLWLLNWRCAGLAESSVGYRSSVVERWPDRGRRLLDDHLAAHDRCWRPDRGRSRGAHNASLYRSHGEIALHFSGLHLLLVDADI